MTTDVVALTQRLIAIPSYVDKSCNETKLAQYLEAFITANLLQMSVTRMPLKKQPKRYNLIISDGEPPRLLFLSHMDTVIPSSSNQLDPVIKMGRIYGRGAADMKGGIAALLTAVKKACRTKGLTMIFDCDEEYAFGGIKQLLTKNPRQKAKLLVCPEPTNLKLISSCRGLLEMSISLKGKSAHAARPQQGINAITGAVALTNRLQQELSSSSVNLAYMQGGLAVNSTIKKQPNAVPDRARFTLDIRPSWRWSEPDIIKHVVSICCQQQLTIESMKIQLSCPGYSTPKSSLQPTAKIIQQVVGETIYRSPKISGYYEAALANQAWSTPSVVFGPTGPSHTSNEYVTIDSLQKCQSVYQQLIEYYCK